MKNWKTSQQQPSYSNACSPRWSQARGQIKGSVKIRKQRRWILLLEDIKDFMRLKAHTFQLLVVLTLSVQCTPLRPFYLRHGGAAHGIITVLSISDVPGLVAYWEHEYKYWMAMFSYLGENIVSPLHDVQKNTILRWKLWEPRDVSHCYGKHQTSLSLSGKTRQAQGGEWKTFNSYQW